MKLGTKGQYAVMAMVDMAKQTGTEKDAAPVALSDIALRQEISLSYLEQLFAKLRRAELVVSVRGKQGGYKLAASAEDIRISDIIAAVDEPISTTRCKPGGPVGCTGSSARCLTHDLWEELGRQIHVFLDSISLADILARDVLGKGAVLTSLSHLASHSEEPRP